MNHYLKSFLLMAFIASSFAAGAEGSIAAAPCGAPTNPPKKITTTQPTANSITCTIEPGAAGTSAAEIYLVLVSTRETAPTLGAPPFAAGTTVGDYTIVSNSPETTVTATGLKAGSKYYFFAYAGKANGQCYNTTPVTANGSTSKTPSNTDDEKSSGSKLSALMDFNFAGKQNKWSNLTPAVYYGFSEQFKTFGAASTLQIGPYVGSTIDIKDSTSFLPALMLPGNAGVLANYSVRLGNEDNFSVVLSPLSFGLKVVSGFKDSTLSIVQHNIRHMVGIQWGKKFSLSAQYTQAWHSLISTPEENFHKIFNTAGTKVTYWNVTLTSLLAKDIIGGDKTQAPLYLALSWRSFNKPEGIYKLPNARILTLSLITDLNLTSATNPGHSPFAPSHLR